MVRYKEKIMEIVFFIAMSMSVIAVLLISVFLFVNGIPTIKEIGVFNFLLGKNWRPGNDMYGIFPMILGSIYITTGAIIVGVPLGLLTAVYLTFFCPDKIYRFMKPAVELLASVPSVVFGFFGMTVLVPKINDLFGNRGGESIFTASILLGIMILPTIISISETSLRAVPKTYYEGSLALGQSHEKSIFKVMIPAAKSGILAGIVLGIGRAIGETMAVIMVAGNQARVPTGILKGVRTMTANIVLEMGYAADLHRQALIATGVVLFVFILLINLLFSMIKRRGE